MQQYVAFLIWASQGLTNFAKLFYTSSGRPLPFLQIVQRYKIPPNPCRDIYSLLFGFLDTPLSNWLRIQAKPSNITKHGYPHVIWQLGGPYSNNEHHLPLLTPRTLKMTCWTYLEKKNWIWSSPTIARHLASTANGTNLLTVSQELKGQLLSDFLTLLRPPTSLLILISSITMDTLSHYANCPFTTTF